MEEENQALLQKKIEDYPPGGKKTNICKILSFLLGVAGFFIAIIIILYINYYTSTVGRIYYNCTNKFTKCCRVESDGTECVGHAGKGGV